MQCKFWNYILCIIFCTTVHNLHKCQVVLIFLKKDSAADYMWGRISRVFPWMYFFYQLYPKLSFAQRCHVLIFLIKICCATSDESKIGLCNLAWSYPVKLFPWSHHTVYAHLTDVHLFVSQFNDTQVIVSLSTSALHFTPHLGNNILLPTHQ